MKHPWPPVGYEHLPVLTVDEYRAWQTAIALQEKPAADPTGLEWLPPVEIQAERERRALAREPDLPERYGWIPPASAHLAELAELEASLDETAPPGQLFDPAAFERETYLTAKVLHLRKMAVYYKSPHWHAFRQYVIDTLAATCQGCEEVRDPQTLHVHHRRYGDALWNETLDDVMLLCGGCHTRLHNRAGRRPGTRPRRGRP